jgi:hypothetical protein
MFYTCVHISCVGWIRPVPLCAYVPGGKHLG